MIPHGAIAEVSRRVLIIESSLPDRELLRDWLHREGIEVHEAADVESGLEASVQIRPDVILLQLRLPDGDGFEGIRRLKNDPRTRSIPVILLAASAQTAEKAKGIELGALDFLSKPFEPVELLARVGSALRMKALLDLLDQRAHLDGLTELGNRFALRDRLEEEWNACRQQRRTLAILIADLDFFKGINDQYGHSIGDEVLRLVAKTLRRIVRRDDFVARYGGEEFVVVAPDCHLDGAVAMANRFRREVAELNPAVHAQPIRLTCSVGVALALDLANTSPHQVLDQADRALLQAKQAGRNALWVWDPALHAPRPVAKTL